MEDEDLATVEVDDEVQSTEDVFDDSPVDEPVVTEDVPDTEPSDVDGGNEDAVVEDDNVPLIDRLSQEEIQERIAAYDELLKVKEQHERHVSNTGRLAQQWGEERKQYQAQLEEFNQRLERERAEAEARNLAPYDRKHPDYDRWQNLLSQARNDQKTLALVQDPDVRAQMEQAIQQKYTAEEQSLISGYQDYVQNQSTGFFSNPKDYIRNVFEELAPQYFQQYRSVEGEWSNVERGKEEFFSQNKDILDAYGTEVLELMNANTPANVAVELVKLRHGNESLSQTAAKSAEKEATAKAQAEALGSKAKLPTGGPRNVPTQDISEGLSPSMKDSDFIDALARRRV